MNEPIIIVTFNYRLNIFAFGDGSGEKSLAVQGQRLAIEWASKHIRGLGGDEVRTVASALNRKSFVEVSIEQYYTRWRE